jgi:hypothetical protein
MSQPLLQPLTAVMKKHDVDYLLEKIADVPPLQIDEASIQANGWTRQSLMIGQVLTAVCDLIRQGQLEFETPQNV